MNEKKMQQERDNSHHLCGRPYGKLLLSASLSGGGSRRLGHFFRLLCQIIRGDFMKVVIFKSPKFLSGILRLIFGIKKENT